MAAVTLALPIGGGAGLAGATGAIQEPVVPPASGIAHNALQSFTDSLIARVRSLLDARARDLLERIPRQP